MQFKSFFNMQQPNIRHKWMVFSRIIAAIFAGYLAVSMITIALTLILIRAKIVDSQAILSATLPSFLIYSVIVIFIFSCKSLKKMWLWMAGLIMFPSLVIFMLENIRT